MRIICSICNKECERTSYRQKVCVGCRDFANKQKAKEWYKNNLDTKKQYWKLHPDKLKEYNARPEVKKRKRLSARKNYDPEKRKIFNQYPKTKMSKSIYSAVSQGYTKEFALIKEQVKERDRYVCRDCGCDDRRRLIVHHLDYNKKNNRINNLITLCRSCHPARHART